MNKTIGVLAHVDAGKTTFSEQVLLTAGAIRQAGRVDHGDAFLDAHPLERTRGITIFSDQAVFTRGGDTYFWVDTPGHTDFAAEMARCLKILDYAVLVISAAQGVQGHSEVIWQLLRQHQIPVFIFVNKLDRPETSFEATLAQLKARLSPDVCDVRSLAGGGMDETLLEHIASRDEALMEDFFADQIDPEKFLDALREQIRTRKVFPVLGGAALHGEGVGAFLDALQMLTYTDYETHTAEPFCAQVYKIRHDAQGQRLCFAKILSGTLRARDEIALPDGESEKALELRRCQGAKFEAVKEASAGELVAIAGLKTAAPGDIIGCGAKKSSGADFEPMMAASVVWEDEPDKNKVLRLLRLLEDEEPTLHIVYHEQTGTIEAHTMGPIQQEVLVLLAQERFGLKISFGQARVLYRETIAAPCVGIGHYEPLRHYAEVHLRLVPIGRGEGVQFRSLCHVDDLALNWQRLIETHVFEKTHRGILTGAPLTDVRVELLCGRAHLKHTEGGDFRESTYRAIRNALMYGRSVLLEPMCRFYLRAPAEAFGRVMGDLARLGADTQAPDTQGDFFTVSGEVAFARISTYYPDFLAATRGRGSLSYALSQYAPCQDAQAVIDAAQYQPLADDTPDSVFCSHGAGFTVRWDEVKNYAHLETPLD